MDRRICIPFFTPLLKQCHRKVEMATNNSKIGQNCNSDREKSKYNRKVLTATWFPPQYSMWNNRFWNSDILTSLRGAVKKYCCCNPDILIHLTVTLGRCGQAYSSVHSKHAQPPPSGHLSGICQAFVSPGSGICQKHSLPGDGAFANSSRSG